MTSRWTRADTVTAGLLAVLTVALRWPFRTRFAYSWDCANFVLATRQFDLHLDLPHAAGYIVYVQLGRLGGWLGFDVHAFYLGANILAAAAGTALIYHLAHALWGRPAAVTAGVLFATSPLTWFYADVAYADLWDATLGLALGSLAWRQQQRPGLARALLATVVYSLAAGIRQQNLVFLFPLWAWALWTLPWSGRLAAAAFMAVASAGWAVPLLQSVGGLAAYLAHHRAHARAGFDGYLWSSWRDFLSTGTYLRYILSGFVAGAGLLFLAGPFWLVQMRRRLDLRRARRSPVTWLLGLWFLPPFLFLLLVHLNVRPGLTLGMLPPLLLLTAGACATVDVPAGRLLHGQTWGKLLAVGTAANLFLFLASESPVSRWELQTHDQRLAAEYAAIRRRFDPRDTLLLGNVNWYWYSARQAALHLPEYELWYLDAPNPERWWVMEGGRTRLLKDLRIPAWVKNVVFIHEHRSHEKGEKSDVADDLIHREPLPGGTYLCWMPMTGAWRDLIRTEAWNGPRPPGEPVLPRPRP